MSPSPAAIAWIAGQSPAWSTQTDAQIAAALNGSTAANPVGSAPKIPSTCFPSDILPLIGSASLAKIDPSGFAPALYADMDAGNVAGVGRWAAYFATIGSITGAEYQTITAHLAGTAPDPAWTPTLPAPLVALGRLLDAADIAAARAAGGH